MEKLIAQFLAVLGIGLILYISFYFAQSFKKRIKKKPVLSISIGILLWFISPLLGLLSEENKFNFVIILGLISFFVAFIYTFALVMAFDKRNDI